MTCENQISKLDAWAASSLLQKAIRRGDNISACAAAETLYRWRGARIWNRLQLIAIEDVGIADTDLVSDFKNQLEKLDAQTSSFGFGEIQPWVRRLAEAAKDRSADYLICVANSHPDFESDRVGLRFFPPTDLVATALDPGQPASRRAVAAWYASGVPSGRPVPMPECDAPPLYPHV